ncbi:MAG: hypothetical protein SO287_10725 [Parabacteroides sp.]|nr:hypothetical protein [Parabacteroides sp.]
MIAGASFLVRILHRAGHSISMLCLIGFKKLGVGLSCEPVKKR